jgi:osmotically-inducible protein OsmY
LRSDEEIRTDVITELNWEPSLNNDNIAVAVRNGIVTLAGYVDSFAEKWTAERVASGVRGVKAVANSVEVRLPSGSQRPDPDIAAAAVNALKWDIFVPDDAIKVTVDKGWVTLSGDVDWYYQKEEAENAVRRLTGVKGVTNLIAVHARPAPTDVKQKINDALQRSAEFDANRITVEVNGSKVTLRGTVRSFAEFRDAGRAALNAPGVTDVENDLRVDPGVFATV